MTSQTKKQHLNTSRRKILKGVAGTTALSTLGFPAIVPAATPLVVNSYGGAFEKFIRSEIIPDFESSTGIKTLVDINLGKGWLTTLRAAGPENPPYDVLMTNETWASVERGEGFFEAIPEDKVPNMADLYPVARYKDNIAVIGMLSPLGLLYRTDQVPEPKSWADLWSVPEYRGKTGLYTVTNSAGYMTILMTARNWFGSEYEVDKAIDKIKELKPFLQADFGGTMEKYLIRGEVAIAPADFAAKGRMMSKGIGEKVEVIAPKEGMFCWEQVFNVLKGSKKKEEGYQWINYILTPEVQKKFVIGLSQAPVNKKTQVPADFKGVHGERMNEIVMWDWAKANAVRDHVIERWNKEMR